MNVLANTPHRGKHLLLMVGVSCLLIGISGIIYEHYTWRPPKHSRLIAYDSNAEKIVPAYGDEAYLRQWLYVSQEDYDLWRISLPGTQKWQTVPIPVIAGTSVYVQSYKSGIFQIGLHKPANGVSEFPLGERNIYEEFELIEDCAVDADKNVVSSHIVVPCDYAGFLKVSYAGEEGKIGATLIVRVDSSRSRCCEKRQIDWFNRVVDNGN